MKTITCRVTVKKHIEGRNVKLAQYETYGIMTDVFVYKMNYKDEKRGLGSRGGYRLLGLILMSENKAIPFHLYHKRSGKRPKKDLSTKEKNNIRQLVESLNEEVQ